jgi:hypothetical protein
VQTECAQVDLSNLLSEAGLETSNELPPHVTETEFWHRWNAGQTARTANSLLHGESILFARFWPASSLCFAFAIWISWQLEWSFPRMLWLSPLYFACIFLWFMIWRPWLRCSRLERCTQQLRALETHLELGAADGSKFLSALKVLRSTHSGESVENRRLAARLYRVISEADSRSLPLPSDEPHPNPDSLPMPASPTKDSV